MYPPTNMPPVAPPIPEDIAPPESPMAEMEIPKELQEPEVDDKEIEDALVWLMKNAREEDRFMRDDQLIQWKRLEYYWNNILDIFLDPVSRDWRVPNWADLEEEGEVPARLINIYRPHGESIVAALSVTIPSVLFHPDDADNPDDVESAKVYKSIVELLELHNNAPMLFIRALVILFNQGTIFGYNYYHRDPKYGMIEKPRVEFKDIDIFEAHCPECGEPLDAGAVPQGQGMQPPPPNQGMQPPMPPQAAPAMPPGMPPQGMPPQGVPGQEQGLGQPSYKCENCGYSGPADISQSTENLPQIVGFDKSPKGTIRQELYSGLNVKVPAYVREQESCGYLLLEFTQSIALLRSVFPEVADKIIAKQDNTWESFQKMPLQYLGMMPDNAANVSCIWLRPYQFWQYNPAKKEVIKALLKQFPDGCYAIFVNDDFMEAYPEAMDEHWTISKNPLGSFIYGRPLGENLATVQDIRANLVEIEIQTAEHGIPETFADGKVLDFNKYGQGRAQPGMVTQVQPRAGKSISDAFFSTKSAILSQEIDPLRQHLDTDAQFIVGDFPSVYGGPSLGGSKTAAEYSQSKAQALQRLGNYWRIICEFWTNLQSRSAVEYANAIKQLNQDERFTKREGKNNFVNVWIRSVTLNGKIGRVEPESSEQLPISWGQKKDAITQLLTLGIPEIMQTLMHPRNVDVMKTAFGLSDVYIPGEDDRIRQFKEFSTMSQGVPVPTNQLLDNADIHIEILQSILVGPVGDSLEPQIMQICMQHLQEHMQYQQQQQQQQMDEQIKMQQALKAGKPGSSAPDKKPKENSNVPS